MKISFAGMGIMGSNMAKNLVKAGYEVMIWNRSANKNVAGVLESGAKQAADKKELCGFADIVCMCLGDEKSVESFVAELDDIQGKLFIDFTTIGPQSAKNVAQILAEKGAKLLDAPISGGDIGAKNGTLAIMVGGEKSDFDAVGDIFSVLGGNIEYCGPTGSGQAVKLVNQLLGAVNLFAVKEAFAVAKSFGVSGNTIVNACSSGAGGSWQLANLGKKAMAKEFEPGFKLEHLRKDLRLLEENFEGNLPFSIDHAIKIIDDLLEKNIISNEEGTQAVLKNI